MKIITEAAFYDRREVFKLLLLSLCILITTPASSLNFPQKITRQTALAAFEKNDHEQALRQFSELSKTYPKDPLYKYYCGVCMLKLEREPSRAASLLNDAINGSAAIRTVPEDGVFWLGRAQQMSGKFTEAIGSYNRFTSQAGKKMAKEMDVPGYIKQCQEKKGMVEETVVAAGVITVSKPVEKDADVKPLVPGKDSVVLPLPPLEKPATAYDSLLDRALTFQVRSDSLSGVAEKLGMQMAVSEGAAKNGLKIKIQNLEKAALENRKKADATMAEAQKLSGIVLSPDTGKVKPPLNDEPAINDTANQAKTAAIPAVVVAPQEKEIFSEFEIIQKPVYKPDEKITVNPEVPPGLIYRIQVAVFRNPVAPSYFKGIKPVQGFRNPANGITTYYAGMFRRSADASKSLTRVRAMGFKDSFVTALMDKKAVSPDRAAVLEKEWGAKPLYKIKPAAPDTVPKTLVFRVEVKRSPKPLPKDQVENIKKMAGTRDFDIIVTEKKQSIYLAGIFLTYKSASEYADLLVRNGYRDSKVVAYLGNREIPVETARQLFDEH